MNRQNLLILLCMLLLFPVSGQSNNREKYNFNPGWLLYIGDTPGAEKSDFSDENWKKITLPRAFNEDEAFKVHIWGMTDTIAWYRKHFRLPKTAKGKKVFSGSLFQWNDRNFNANYGGALKNVWLHITDKLYQALPLYSNLQTTGTYIYASDIKVKAFSKQREVRK